MSRFAQIPEIPTGTPQALVPVLQAIKQNLEALTGQSGIDRLAQAVRFGEVRASDFDQKSVPSVAAPTKAEFDVVVSDLDSLRASYNYLLAQLRGEDVGT